MQRKAGGYRKPTSSQKLLSVIAEDRYSKWFRQIWSDVTGASTKDHPAPYPVALAERLIRMFSFAGDVVLDPFAGTGSTLIAAANAGRNSIGIELDPEYTKFAADRIVTSCTDLYTQPDIMVSM
ncbi:MAG: site-specific DNA-methyltransferase [Phycisphaerales bacterium]|nr:site-specific DNA-methyltransferase [Phycisphaerales bacterium]